MKPLYALLAPLVLSGCAALQADYVAPASGPTATVEVVDGMKVINRRVLVHGAEICNGSQARLAGLMRSRTIGIAYAESIILTVEAGKPLAISSPYADVESMTATKMNFKYCQPVVAFTPAPGRRYRIDFDTCSARLDEVPVRAYEGCDLGPGNNPGARMFFLVPKK